MYDLKIWQHFVNIRDFFCFFWSKICQFGIFFYLHFLPVTEHHTMQCENAGILIDLRNQPPGNKMETFKQFFAETEKYLAEDIGVACHERRHSE